MLWSLEHSAETFVVGLSLVWCWSKPRSLFCVAQMRILNSSHLAARSLARLVRAGLQEQKLTGAQKALVKEVRMPPAVLKAFTGAVAENDF